MTILVLNFKKPRFAILGAYNTFDNKFDQYRTKVCPEIKVSNYRLEVCPDSKNSLFIHNVEHINSPLSGLFWRTEKCKTKDLRGGAFRIGL